MQQLLQQKFLLQEEDLRRVLWVHYLIGTVFSQDGFIIGSCRHQSECQHDQADGLWKDKENMVLLIRFVSISKEFCRESYHDKEFHVGRFLFVFRLAEEVTLSDSTVPS